MPKKPNKDLVLTPRQKQMLVGGLLGDCWIELGKGAQNARVGLQLSKKTEPYLVLWIEAFREWITQETYSTVKAYGSGADFPQLSVRTTRHPEFTAYYNVFRPSGSTEKIVPPVSWLMDNFTDVSLAELFAQDGSRHGLNAAAGFNIHSQGFGFEGSARIALMLYEKFGLYAYPTRDVHKKINKVYWNVYISSDSYQDFVKLVQGKILPTMLADKIKAVGPSKPNVPNPKNNQPKFYAMFKDNQDLRENPLYVVPSSEIEAYALALSSKPGLS